MVTTIKDTWFDQQAKTNLESVTHHKFQTQSKFEPWVRVKLFQSSKIKTRPKTQRIQRLKQCKIMRRGPKFEKFGENGCSYNTTLPFLTYHKLPFPNLIYPTLECNMLP